MQFKKKSAVCENSRARLVPHVPWTTPPPPVDEPCAESLPIDAAPRTKTINILLSERIGVPNVPPFSSWAIITVLRTPWFNVNCNLKSYLDVFFIVDLVAYPFHSSSYTQTLPKPPDGFNFQLALLYLFGHQATVHDSHVVVWYPAKKILFVLYRALSLPKLVLGTVLSGTKCIRWICSCNKDIL